MKLKQLTRGLMLVALTGGIAAGPAAPAARIVNGTGIQVQAAPWAVFVQQLTGSGHYRCSGSVVDPSHVLTAAHCVFDEAGNIAQPADLSVRAGVSSFSAPLSTDLEQDRSVSSIRVQPGYVPTGKPAPDDVAVLVLSTPLDLSGPAVQAVALPSAGSPFPTRAPVGIAGFGRQVATSPSNGSLEWMTAAVDSQGSCGGSNGFLKNNAILLCVSSPTSSVCNGDSGSGIVTTAGTPTLIAVVNAVSTGCGVGSHALAAYTGAPEILQFIQGNDQPPSAPREDGGTFISLEWSLPLVVGGTLSCTTGDWIGQAEISYSFVNWSDGRLLQTGTQPTYTLPATALGTRILCQVSATNAGGTELEQTEPTAVVANAPPAKITPVAPLAGTQGSRFPLRIVQGGKLRRSSVQLRLPARAKAAPKR